MVSNINFEGNRIYPFSTVNGAGSTKRRYRVLHERSYRFIDYKKVQLISRELGDWCHDARMDCSNLLATWYWPARWSSGVLWRWVPTSLYSLNRNTCNVDESPGSFFSSTFINFLSDDCYSYKILKCKRVQQDFFKHVKGDRKFIARGD